MNRIKRAFNQWAEWIGLKTPERKYPGIPIIVSQYNEKDTIKIPKTKTRKHYSRPTKVQTPKKGKGSYKRNKKVKTDE